MKRWAVAILAIVVIVAMPLFLTPGGNIDRCLDHGGRWNYDVGRCECTPEELASPTVTKEFIDYCETPHPAPAS